MKNRFQSFHEMAAAIREMAQISVILRNDGHRFAKLWISGIGGDTSPKVLLFYVHIFNERFMTVQNFQVFQIALCTEYWLTKFHTLLTNCAEIIAKKLSATRVTQILHGYFHMLIHIDMK